MMTGSPGDNVGNIQMETECCRKLYFTFDLQLPLQCSAQITFPFTHGKTSKTMPSETSDISFAVFQRGIKIPLPAPLIGVILAT